MEDEKEFDLSEGQRIALLERTVSFNRKVVIVLIVLSVVGLSALSTLGIVSLLKAITAYNKVRYNFNFFPDFIFKYYLRF